MAREDGRIWTPGLALLNCPAAGLMVSMQLYVSGSTYNALISACARKADVASYSSVIHACAKANDLQRAETTSLGLSRWNRMGCRPNVVTYNSAINACARCGDVTRAEHWFHKLRAEIPHA
ncbi:unnamed protein product [Durusdinium trenchii]|uniref:Pentatricopeptide repeat-containing protein n=1 Tax=Durusdinium trenchii TaxID=1381693 RepID=A0ABP0MGV1_9DINO